MSPDYDPHASSLPGTADPAVLDELFAIRGSIDYSFYFYNGIIQVFRKSGISKDSPHRPLSIFNSTDN